MSAQRTGLPDKQTDRRRRDREKCQNRNRQMYFVRERLLTKYCLNPQKLTTFCIFVSSNMTYEDKEWPLRGYRLAQKSQNTSHWTYEIYDQPCIRCKKHNILPIFPVHFQKRGHDPVLMLGHRPDVTLTLSFRETLCHWLGVRCVTYYGSSCYRFIAALEKLEMGVRTTIPPYREGLRKPCFCKGRCPQT